MVKHAKALALVLGCVAVACAVKPLAVATYPTQPRFEIMVSTTADRELTRLADLTRSTRREQAACVSLYTIKHLGGEKFLFVILKLDKSNPYDSDSLRVWTLNKKPFCTDSLPNIHTHVVMNETWGKPSEWDMEHSQDWSSAPFKVLLSVQGDYRKASKLTLYGIR